MGKCLSKTNNSVNKVRPTPTPDSGAKKKMRRRKNDTGLPKERYAIVEGRYDVKLPREKTCTINCSAFLPTGDIIFGDQDNKNIKLFNCNFDFMTCIEFPDPVQCLCASPNLPLIYAIFPDRIRQIHVDGVNMKKSGFIKTPGECRAMVVNKFDGKAISLYMPDDFGQVNLLTPGGSLQLELFADNTDQMLFIDPGPLVVTRNLTIAVADRAQQAVIGVQPDGQVQFRYKGIRTPTAIICDEQNYIYVAGPKMIHQLSEKGELVKLFLTKAEIGLAPMSLAYFPERKHLIVTGKGSKVTLFKLT
ncbi:uncharacterized protein LOC128237245 [Mya arenaria]|nr:uncharacterized protein LOC128237245 [Mya arenaria]XP_052808555.1 uncharacterized protein LOC128237245 [Mya arenaria]